jgi:hypothetical protein
LFIVSAKRLTFFGVWAFGGRSRHVMNKLAVIIPFYKRKEITSLCFKHLATQQNKFKFDVFVSGDDYTIVPKSFKVVDCDNLPLGNKLNTLLQQTKAYDGVIILGSDDFISDSIFELYKSIDTTKLVYYGFDNCHLYSVWSGKLGTDFSYTKSGNTIGVARLWTKPTLELMNYSLWTSRKNNGLDTDSKMNMTSKGIKEISLPYSEHFILDVKHELNITNPAIVNTSDTFLDVNEIIARFGSVGNDILDLQIKEVKQINKNKMSKELVNFISNGSFVAKGLYRIIEHKAVILEQKGYGKIERKEVEKPKTTRTIKAK